MNDTIEPSVEFGKFVVASIFQAIREFAGIKGKSREDIIERVKRWNTLIIHLDYFKTIHNLAQSYLINTNFELFGGGGGKRRLTKSTSGRVIERVWNTSYKNDFKKQIDDFKIETDTFIRTMGVFEKEYQELSEFNPDFYIIQKNIDKIESYAHKAYAAIHTFVKEIEKVAEKAFTGNDILNIENWKRPLEANACEAASSADEVILNLIPVLSFLYRETLSIEQ